MKYEIHPASTYCNDKSRMYAEVHSRVLKDLLKTWVYKPIRDLYWESLKNSYYEDKDYQPYALMKHKCGHRTVGVVAMCRNKLGRDGIIKYLKEERESDCFYCMFTRNRRKMKKPVLIISLLNTLSIICFQSIIIVNHARQKINRC